MTLEVLHMRATQSRGQPHSRSCQHACRGIRHRSMWSTRLSQDLASNGAKLRQLGAGTTLCTPGEINLQRGVAQTEVHSISPVEVYG